MTSVITTAEVNDHNKRDSLWLIIHGDVYDVTKFIEEHPGGEDTLLDAAGSDATDAFEDVGHSEDARELLKKYKIGTLPRDEKFKKNKPTKGCESYCKPRSPIRKMSCSNCNSVSSCLAVNTVPPKQAEKCWRNFDDPTPGSELSTRASKNTRFVVPPDKCDEPTSTAAVKKVLCDDEKSIKPKRKKKTKKKGCDKRHGGPPCDSCGRSNWKMYALAAVVLSAIVAGVMAYKRQM